MVGFLHFQQTFKFQRFGRAEVAQTQKKVYILGNCGIIIESFKKRQKKERENRLWQRSLYLCGFH